MIVADYAAGVGYGAGQDELGLDWKMGNPIWISQRRLVADTVRRVKRDGNLIGEEPFIGRIDSEFLVWE